MSIVSISDVLKQEVLDYLVSDAVLIKTITDLTSQVMPGADRVTIPNVSGLSLENITSGVRATAGGMSTTGSVLLLNNVKQVPEYVSYAEGIQSAIDLKASFLMHAPKVFAEGIEKAIATKLLVASANDFDSVSATAGVFAVSDIAKAKKLLDMENVPVADRYLAVNAEAMELLSSFSEFQDGQKSLSPEALREGIVSRVKGFNVIQSNNLPGTGATLKLVAYHKSAVAFALQSAMEYIEKDIPEYAEWFLSLRGLFGVIDCDNASNLGVRKVVITCSTATA